MSLIAAVTIPKWGMTMTEGTITQWMAKEGESVVRGQDLLEIETTKVTNIVESAVSGMLRQIVLKEGTTAPIGALAGVIADETVTQAEIDVFIQSYTDRLDKAAEAEGGPAPRAIEVDGASVNVLEAGPLGDETVVFLHGFGGDLSAWLFNQPAIAETVHTVAVDLPGHGASTPVTDDGDVLARIVSAVQAALDTVTSGRLHLVAHSFGGSVAAALASLHPERVASLTLIAPIGLGSKMNRDFLIEFITAERRRPLLAVLETLFADPSRITSDMVEGTLRFKRLEGVPEALSAIANIVADDNGTQLQSIDKTLSQLTCPIMLIWGERDAIVPLPGDAEITANVQLRIIPAVGHMPQMEASQIVNTLILTNIGDLA